MGREIVELFCDSMFFDMKHSNSIRNLLKIIVGFLLSMGQYLVHHDPVF